MTESAQGADGGNDALAKLGKLLQTPEGRKQFFLDPDKALSTVGVKRGDIPEPVRATLSDLSYEELRVIARVNASLDKANVPAHIQAEMV